MKEEFKPYMDQRVMDVLDEIVRDYETLPGNTAHFVDSSKHNIVIMRSYVFDSEGLSKEITFSDFKEHDQEECIDFLRDISLERIKLKKAHRIVNLKRYSTSCTSREESIIDKYIEEFNREIGLFAGSVKRKVARIEIEKRRGKRLK
jgi:hypothetical protein